VLHDVVASHVQEEIGAKEVALLLADYAETSLERVPDEEGSHSVSVDASPAGAAFRSQQLRVAADNGGWRVHVPVTVRAERLGMLDVLLAEEPSDEVVTLLEQSAVIVGYVIATARRYTDLFERVRRRRDLVLAAEIQWELLPVLAYEGAEFSVAGALEPAYAIAGDSFDYAVEAEHLHLTLTDGMGHGLRAAILTSLAVSALRNARRREREVLDQVRTANQVLFDQFGGEQFVTGQMARLDVVSGEAAVVNAGHPRPRLVRAKAVEVVPLHADIPMGLYADTRYRVQRIPLEPGDRLVLLSDGVLEATDPDGRPYGPERFAQLMLESADLLPTEVVRLVTRSVMAHRAAELRDDATVLCVDWKGRSQ
jgi:serine phosphatase RsbU (regulator of sigma subunit)